MNAPTAPAFAHADHAVPAIVPESERLRWHWSFTYYGERNGRRFRVRDHFVFDRVDAETASRLGPRPSLAERDSAHDEAIRVVMDPANWSESDRGFEWDD